MRSWILVALPSIAPACGGHAPAPPTIASGQVPSASWPGAPLAIIAHGRKASQRAALDSSGAFALQLPKGDTYALAVQMADREVPVVFPRASGALDASFKVSSDGVALALGAVRYVSAGAKPTFAVGGAGHCAAGTLCVAEDGATCEDGQGDPGSSTNETPDTSSEADANAEMAVPEHDAPSDAAGCDSQDGQDQVDQEGEH